MKAPDKYGEPNSVLVIAEPSSETDWMCDLQIYVNTGGTKSGGFCCKDHGWRTTNRLKMKYERHDGKEISDEAQVAHKKTTPNQKAECATAAPQPEA